LDYRKVESFDGDVARVFEPAVVILTTLGFRLVEQGARSVSFRGPGMHSSRQPGLLGASYLRLTHDDGSLQLEAELGGTKLLERFVTWFPPALAAAIGATLAILLGLQFGWPAVTMSMSTAFLTCLPWKLLSPVLVRWIRARSVRALDVLLINLASGGQTRQS
jgi:hypothetical protein